MPLQSQGVALCRACPSMCRNSAECTRTRITLVGTESGVGVANAGTIAAQAGDFVLTTAGQLVQAGQMRASGDAAISAGTVENSGTVYARQSAAIASAGALANSGTLAAQRDMSIRADGVASTGLLGAGIDSDGSLGTSGNLTVTATGLLSANGQNVAAGKVALGGVSLDLSGAQTWAGTALNLAATGGDLSLVHATTGAGFSVTVSVAGVLDNRGGALTAQSSATIEAGSLDNGAGGLIAAHDVSIADTRAFDNAGGSVQANGTLDVAAHAIVNDGGVIANGGAGTTTVAAVDALTNTTGGLIGGNGDVSIAGGSIYNREGSLVAGGALSAQSGSTFDNAAGLIDAGDDVSVSAQATITNTAGQIGANGSLRVSGASLDNTSGRIGNDVGSGGSIAITTGTLTNQNGAIGSDRNLTLTTNRLAGDGAIVAGQDGAVTVNGDYTHDAANQIQANRDLAFTVTGNLTNDGTLAAVNALTVTAANVDNQAGGTLNSARTSVNAVGAISNEGRIEGDAVTTNSATLINTATIIGNTVTLNGSQSIANAGAGAIIAGASGVNLYSAGDISNTGGANVFSLGDLNIAANAARDAEGLLANRANSVTNDQSTLQAQGNVEIAAQTLTNTRPTPDVETVTTDVSTVHQTKRAKYIGCTTVKHNPADGACSGDETSGTYQFYVNPLTVTYAAADVVSQSSGPEAIDRALVVNIDGTPQTIWYNTATANPDGSVTVTYWDAYDPRINFDPASEYTTLDDAHHAYQRVEIARDTTTTTQQDEVIGTPAMQAQLLAGGNLMLANVGTLDNAYSAIVAGGSIQIRSTIQDGTLDTGGSGSYGGTLVNNVGQTLYRYTNTYYQQIAGVNQTFVSSGNAQTAGVKLERVIRRSQNDVSGVEFQLIKRFGASFIDDTGIPQQYRNNTFVEAGLTNRHYFGAAQFDGTLAYRQGVDASGAMPDASGAPTYRFHMATLDANLSMPFAVAGQTVRYVGTLHGQFTSDELNYIDDLSIGSRYTVRGFSGQTMLAAEKGFYWRNELQYAVGTTGQALYAGLDYGHLWGPSSAYLAGTQLAGAVLGLRGGIPTRRGNYSYDAFIGTPVYAPSGFPTSSVTLGFQVTGQF